MEKKDKKNGRTPEVLLRQLLGSRHTLILIESNEELRIERSIATGAAAKGFQTVFWDCATGATDAMGQEIALGEQPATNPHSLLDEILAAQAAPEVGPDGKPKAGARKRPRPATVWVLRDLHRWWDDAVICRRIKSLRRQLQEELDPARFGAIIVLAPASATVPPDLIDVTTILEWPLPNREVIGQTIDDFVMATNGAKLGGTRDELIDAAAGLPTEDISNALSLAYTRYGQVDPREVSDSKKAIIDRDPGLTWYQPDSRGLDAIGGLGALKPWLLERRFAFSPEARAYGLPPVRGVLLVGISGCGKSLTAKCVATAFEVPLLRMDLGALKGGIVGQSEANIRRALKTAEAIQRCVLWLDEVGRSALAQKGGLDSGVSDDQVGTILTWSEECQLPIFMVATCNDPSGLPPELLSRFDEVFFVDLPSESERAEIAGKSIAFCGREPAAFDLAVLAAATPGFSGRELNKLVKAGLFRAFSDGRRELNTDDLLAIAKTTVPVSRSAAEQVDSLRAWAKGRARNASAYVGGVETTTGPAEAAGLNRFAALAAGGSDE